MMMPVVRLIFLVSISLTTVAANAAVSDAVVQITVFTDNLRGRYGTGFYWNEQDQVITRAVQRSCLWLCGLGESEMPHADANRRRIAA